MSYATEIVGGQIDRNSRYMLIDQYIRPNGTNRYDITFNFEDECKSYTWTDEIENLIEPLIDLFKRQGSCVYRENGEWFLKGPIISDMGNNITNPDLYTICKWYINPFTDNLPNIDSWSSYTNYTLREVIIDNLGYYPGELL